MITLYNGTIVSKKDMRTWIEALRSGKYKQTKDVLQDKNGFCCLGVACEIFIPKDDKTLTIDGMLYGIFPKNQNSPKWLQHINCDFAHKTSGLELSILNDEKGYSFNQIADELEKTYLGEENEKEN